MGVTRLKRKDRRNKTTAKKEVQFLKLGRNIETGSRSEMPATAQIVKNNAILDKLEAGLKK
ncbi:spore protein [Albibacterium profundi]|uniref:Spore protein n=1 Tax=Albibacterium profundi TaxID=3134906 RepID=A0ABV5CAT7_9SPHI